MDSNQKHSQVFYGWYIVGAGFLISLLTLGFVQLGFTAFFEPIANTFGWSYTQISLAASLRGAEVGLLAPIMGLLVDSWGPRRLAFAGVTFIGIGLVFLSRTTSLAMFYGGFALVAMGIGSCSPTVMSTIVAKWFRKKVGIAVGILASGFALGGLLVPLTVKLIDIFDWRMTLVIIGLTILVFGLPLSMLLRHKPEQYGYLPDGEKSIITAPDQVPIPERTREVDIGTKQALRSRIFWHIGLAMMFNGMAIGTVMAHVMPYLSSISIPRSTASLVAMAVPLSSIAGRLGSGWLSDRYNKKRVTTGFFALMVLGLLCTSLASNETMWIIVPFIILFGIGWGANATMPAAIIQEYFGRSRFGSIYGFSMGMSALGNIIGPLFAGWVFDNWHSYQIAWSILAVLVFAGVLIIATTPPVTASTQLADKQ